MRAWLAVVLAACGSAAPPPPASPPPPAKDWAVAEPWHPAPQLPPTAGVVVMGGRRINLLVPDTTVGPPVVRRRVLPPTADLAQSRADLWYPCVRDLVDGRDAVIRDRLGDALMLYVTACDGVARSATFEPPHRRRYGAGSYVGFAGTVTPTALRLELRIVYRGRAAPERIAIQSAGKTWTSPRVDALSDGTVVVPYTRAVRRALEDALDNDGTVGEIVLTDEMKRDLRVFAEINDLVDP